MSFSVATYFSRTMLKLYTASIKTAWLYSKKHEELACLQTKPSSNWQQMRIPDSWAARILYQWASLSQKCNSWSPKLPDVYGLLLKEQWMIHSGKDVPVPAFWGHVAEPLFFLTWYVFLILNIWCVLHMLLWIGYGVVRFEFDSLSFI